MSCSKAGDLVQSLRGILNAVEKALAALSLLSGLLPDSVNAAARYLTLVCEYVDKVGRLLEDDSGMGDGVGSTCDPATDRANTGGSGGGGQSFPQLLWN